MPKLILHEHPDQGGDCLRSLFDYALSIPLRFDTIESAAAFLRSQPFELDQGFIQSGRGQYGSQACKPWQRQRIWPNTYNCWEATGHWLAHALGTLSGNEVVDIWDRDLSTGYRHVWPTIKREDGIWLVVLDGSSEKRPERAKPANFGWQDVFGALHVAGSGVLGFFLGSDRAAPIVNEAEKLWGGNIAQWAKTGKEAAKAGESAIKYVKLIQGETKQENVTQNTSTRERNTAGMDIDDI